MAFVNDHAQSRHAVVYLGQDEDEDQHENVYLGLLWFSLKCKDKVPIVTLNKVEKWVCTQSDIKKTRIEWTRQINNP